MTPILPPMGLPLNIFYGLDEATLLEIRTGALAELKAGLKVTQRSMAGRGTSFEITASPQEVYRAADQALGKLNPTTYGQPFVNRKKVRFG